MKKRKFKKGDRIVDFDPDYGTGTIHSYEQDYDGEHYYVVAYDIHCDRVSNTYAKGNLTYFCPEDEMRLMTKLDKALE